MTTITLSQQDIKTIAEALNEKRLKANEDLRKASGTKEEKKAQNRVILLNDLCLRMSAQIKNA